MNTTTEDKLFEVSLIEVVKNYFLYVQARKNEDWGNYSSVYWDTKKLLETLEKWEKEERENVIRHNRIPKPPVTVRSWSEHCYGRKESMRRSGGTSHRSRMSFYAHSGYFEPCEEIVLLESIEYHIRDFELVDNRPNYVIQWRRKVLADWDKEDVVTTEDLDELYEFDELKGAHFRFRVSLLRNEYFKKLFGLAKSSEELFFVVKHSRRSRDTWNNAVLKLAKVLRQEKIKEKRRKEEWSAYNYINKIYVENLSSFKFHQFTGIIESVDRGKPDEYGSLKIRLRAKDKTEVFFTKVRKGQCFKLGQKVTFYTLKNRPASAWRYDRNVVRIDIEGTPVYRWKKGEILYVYDGCGNG